MSMPDSNVRFAHVPKTFNRVMYGLFVALAIYHLVFRDDLSDAMSTLGIALIFDPFDQNVDWKRRPRYQNVWLIIHVIVVFALLVALVTT